MWLCVHHALHDIYWWLVGCILSLCISINAQKLISPKMVVKMPEILSEKDVSNLREGRVLHPSLIPPSVSKGTVNYCCSCWIWNSSVLNDKCVHVCFCMVRQVYVTVQLSLFTLVKTCTSWSQLQMRLAIYCLYSIWASYSCCWFSSHKVIKLNFVCTNICTSWSA